MEAAPGYHTEADADVGLRAVDKLTVADSPLLGRFVDWLNQGVSRHSAR
jgi:hypothetical protein